MLRLERFPRATMRAAMVVATVSALTTTCLSPPTGTGALLVTPTDASVALAFTEVSDGMGRAATYDVRYAAGSTLTWGTNATSVTQGTCATPLAGHATGANRMCTVQGLASGTTYSFELVAF